MQKKSNQRISMHILLPAVLEKIKQENITVAENIYATLPKQEEKEKTRTMSCMYLNSLFSNSL